MGILPADFANMTLDQFRLGQKEGKHMFIFTEKIGKRNGSAKTKQGGITFIKMETVTILIWNLNAL